MKNPNWTPAEVAQLDMMLDAGLRDATIGRRLGRSPVAINIIRKRRGLAPRTQRLMSATTVARLMGVPCSKTVSRWLDEGWLRGRRGQVRGPFRQWYVTHEAWLAFLEDPAYWHLWKPERLADSTLRAWAVETRTDIFLTPGQVGKRLGFCHGAVNDWINRGLLPAVRNGNWWIRERDLEGFVPPCDRPKTGRPKAWYDAVEDTRMLQMRIAGGTLPQIARLLGRTTGSVAGRLERLLRCRRCGGRVWAHQEESGALELRCLQCGRRPQDVTREENDDVKIAGTVKEIPPWQGARGKWSSETPRLLQELAKLEDGAYLDLEAADAKEASAVSAWLHGKQWAPFKLEIVKRGLHVYVRPLPKAPQQLRPESPASEAAAGARR